MLKCTVCGHEFEPTAEKHYVARSNHVMLCEDTLYDAFDCPVCGCQIVTKERKRNVVIDEDTEDVESSS